MDLYTCSAAEKGLVRDYCIVWRSKKQDRVSPSNATEYVALSIAAQECV